VARRLRRFLYDTSIFIYALGLEHPYRQPCRTILQRAGADELRGEASPDLLQELVHQRFRRTKDRAAATEAARMAARLCKLHPLEPGDVQRGINLFENHDDLDPRDAVFAALALNRGIDAILATDRAFEKVAGLERIDPTDERAVATLTG
jgi:predicted nucleic acid-binding protein